MGLKEGMYVRSDNGLKFGKIIEVHSVKTTTWYQLDNGIKIDKNELRKNKTSFEKIDLIQVGDYVNSYKITSIQEVEETYYPKRLLYFEEPKDYVIRLFNNEEIESILTKEQFESMSYKVGK